MAEKESRKGGNMAVVVTDFNSDDPTAGLKVVERDIPKPKAGDTGGSVPSLSCFLVCSTILRESAFVKRLSKESQSVQAGHFLDYWGENFTLISCRRGPGADAIQARPPVSSLTFP